MTWYPAIPTVPINKIFEYKEYLFSNIYPAIKAANPTKYIITGNFPPWLCIWQWLLLWLCSWQLLCLWLWLGLCSWAWELILLLLYLWAWLHFFSLLWILSTPFILLHILYPLFPLENINIWLFFHIYYIWINNHMSNIFSFFF